MDNRRVITAIIGASVLSLALAPDPVRASPDAATAPEPSATKVQCPQGRALRVEGKVASDAIDELSGLVASRKQPGVIWVHNDSGDKGNVFAIDVHGRLLLKVKLDDVKAKDVEDIAIGKDADGGDALYLSDTGDNEHKREHVNVYRLAEPKVSLGDKQPKQKRAVHSIEVRYEDGPRDVETLLVDPRTNDLFLVEKGPLLSSSQLVGVYRVSAADVEAGRATARRVARLPLGPATSGDMLPDGSGIAIRSYTRLTYWQRRSDESVTEALQRPGCTLPLADLGQQGEAFGFIPDGKGYLTISEGKHANIHRYGFAKPR